MEKLLKRTQFGNPVLRTPARRLALAEVTSPKTQALVADMLYTLRAKRYGLGLAAPQVSEGIALSVILIKPTPSRPELKETKLIVINPEIIQTYGARKQMWEGCISFGGARNFPYAKTLRYRKIRVRYLDETGAQHERDFDETLAHVLQHEVDHLNGILFVERVKDPRTFVMMTEYKKYIMPREQKRRST